MLAKINAIFDRIIDFFAYLSVAAVAFITLIITVNTLTTFFLNMPIDWALRVTEELVMFIAFLAAAWVLRKEGHITIDIVLTHIKPSKRATLDAVTSVVSAIVCLIICLYGIKCTWEVFETGIIERLGSLKFPFAILQAILPVGFLLLFIQFLRRSRKLWRYRGVTPEERAESVEEIDRI